MSKFKGLELLKEDSSPREELESKAGPNQTVVPKSVGKRQDPNYQQISAYVRKDLYSQIRRELIGGQEDFSDLLEHWMEQWLTPKARK
jgi:hypothetical protein